MSAPDIEGVLGRHPQENARPKSHDGDPWKYDGTYVCVCGEEYRAAPEVGGAFGGHRAHVADAIRAELRAWLESEGAFNVASDAIIDARDAFPRRPDDAPSDDVALAALAALAEQVGRVDPSQSDSGSTGIEVCQSADQTSTAGVEG